MSVHPDAQGIGLGRLVTEHLVAWARTGAAVPVHRIELKVFASNERAIRLYESLGFEHEGRRRDFLAALDGSGYKDDLMMGLIL